MTADATYCFSEEKFISLFRRLDSSCINNLCASANSGSDSSEGADVCGSESLAGLGE